jgi:hypothetical protein
MLRLVVTLPSIFSLPEDSGVVKVADWDRKEYLKAKLRAAPKKHAHKNHRRKSKLP